jgi:triacylglycerol lipase
MGATLSPFRYVQLAKHLFQRWIDQPVVKSAWKGKGKAQPLMKGAAPLSASARTSDSSSGSSSSSSSGSSSTSPAPEKPNLTGNIGAGSQNSRHILSPDSRMPAQSTEIYRLMNDERLLHPGRNNAPKEIIVLCHGESCQFRDPGSETC